MLLKYLGHACWYLQIGGHHIYTDIWLEDSMMSSCRRFPDYGDMDYSDMPSPDYLFLTHHHWDHIIPESLQRLRKDTFIITPENPTSLAVLEHLGFSNIFIAKEWEEITIPGGRVIPTPSHVPFAEVGYYFEDASGAVLNLCDSVFDSADIFRINHIAEGKLKISLCPYQSYDEMHAIMRKNSRLYRMLPEKNAALLKNLQSELIIPAADGLWYPDSPYMNKKSFLNTPFEFIDILWKENPAQRCTLAFPLDELGISPDKIHLDRYAFVDLEEIADYYTEKRSFDPEFPTEPPKIKAEDRLKSLSRQRIESFFQYDFFSCFSPGNFDLFQNANCRCLFTFLGTTLRILVDFNRRTVLVGTSRLASHANCGLKIPASIFIKLMEGKELVSRLCQTDCIETWGNTETLARLALDALWYAGFEDMYRIHNYLDHLFSDSKPIKQRKSYFSSINKNHNLHRKKPPPPLFKG